VTLCGIFEWRRISATFFYCLFITVLSLETQLSEVEGWIPITDLTPPHVFACPRTCISNTIFCYLFVFNGLRWEVVVDISGIYDHLLVYLNFLIHNSSVRQSYRILFYCTDISISNKYVYI